MWLIAWMLLGGLLVLVLSGRRNQAEMLRDWQMVLAPWGADVYRELEERVEGESRMIEFAYRRAAEARAAGSAEKARQLLDVGLRVVERTSPDMMTLLRGMGVVSRMAAAVAVVAPLSPWAFRLPQMSGLTLAAAFGHHLLVSTAERFRLRAYVLRHGFGIIKRFLLSHTARIRARHKAPDADWERIAAAREDLRTLSAESLRTFHALLQSLGAEAS